MERIEPQGILLVGADGLLGERIARALLLDGHHVYLADRVPIAQTRRLNEVVTAFPSGATYFQFDMSSLESYRAFFDEMNRFGQPLNVMINTAYPRNSNYGRKLEDVSLVDFNENIGIHLGGYFLAMKEMALYFRSIGGGHIINISSIYGVIAPRFEIYPDGMTMPVEYAAIKAGLIHLTRYFAKYFKNSNVRFNCVSPGGVFDGQNPSFVERYNAHSMGQGMLMPDDLGGTIQYLISPGARFLNGQNIILDDGWTL